MPGFDFSNGFKCSGVHKFKKFKNLSNNIFQLSFYQAKNERKN